MAIIVKIVTPSTRTETRTEITRWAIRDGWTANVWDELVQKLQKLFATRTTQFLVTWFDGEDYCTIRDVSDLQEAVEFMQGECNAAKGVRIYASPEKKEHHTIFGIKPSDEYDAPKEETIPEEVLEPTKETEEDTIQSSEWESLVICNEIPKTEENPKETNTGIIGEPEKDTKEDEPAVVATTIPIASPIEAVMDIPTTTQLPAPNAQPTPFLQCMPHYPMQPMFMPPWACNPYSPMAYATADYSGLRGIQAQQQQQPQQQQQQQLQVPTAPPMSFIQSSNEEFTTTETPAPGTLAAVAAAALEKEKQAKPASIVLPVEEPCTTKAEHFRKDKPSSSKTQYMPLCLQTLRSMGYTQDEKFLKKCIRHHKGNLNKILDELNRNTNGSSS